MATPKPIQDLNVIITAMVRYRDKLAVYLDDASTLTPAQKSAVATAVTNAKTALDAFNADIQSL